MGNLSLSWLERIVLEFSLSVLYFKLILLETVVKEVPKIWKQRRKRFTKYVLEIFRLFITVGMVLSGIQSTLSTYTSLLKRCNWSRAVSTEAFSPTEVCFWYDLCLISEALFSIDLEYISCKILIVCEIRLGTVGNEYEMFQLLISETTLKYKIAEIICCYWQWLRLRSKFGSLLQILGRLEKWLQKINVRAERMWQSRTI